MEYGGDGSLRVEFLFEDWDQKSDIKDVSLIEGDSLFVGSDILAFGKVVAYRFEDSIEVLETGVDVVVNYGDMVVCFEEDLDGDVGADVADTAGHENIFRHFKAIKQLNYRTILDNRLLIPTINLLNKNLCKSLSTKKY